MKLTWVKRIRLSVCLSVRLCVNKIAWNTWFRQNNMFEQKNRWDPKLSSELRGMVRRYASFSVFGLLNLSNCLNYLLCPMELCKKFQNTNTNYYLCYIFTNTGTKIIWQIQQIEDSILKRENSMVWLLKTESRFRLESNFLSNLITIALLINRIKSDAKSFSFWQINNFTQNTFFFSEAEWRQLVLIWTIKIKSQRTESNDIYRTMLNILPFFKDRNPWNNQEKILLLKEWGKNKNIQNFNPATKTSH